ncbi:MAG: biopolymer transporter ExbD [Deltaproteobacteria bacterium]|nr:biopolymer transporter ExbD [Deltaproteobacteria bacterium]
MARRPIVQPPALEVDEPLALALTPIVSLMLLLMAALLLASAWVATSVVVVVAPRIAGDGAGPAASAPAAYRQPVNLTIVITDRGFYLATSGRVLGADLTDTTVARGPTVPRRSDGGYDYSELTRKLIVIKDAFPEENRIVISAEPEVEYGVLVQTMDAARRSRARGILFPDVVLSADVG